MAPTGSQRRQVGAAGILRSRRLAVVTVPSAAVLVGDVTPSPVRQGSVREDAERLDGVDPLRSDGAQVRPVVAEVEHVHELLARMQARELDAPEVLGLLTLDLPVGIGDGQARRVVQGELLEVGPVPPSEGVVDGIRELLERVGARRGEDAPRPGPEVLPVALDEVYADGQPGASHLRPLLLLRDRLVGITEHSPDSITEIPQKGSPSQCRSPGHAVVRPGDSTSLRHGKPTSPRSRLVGRERARVGREGAGRVRPARRISR